MSVFTVHLLPDSNLVSQRPVFIKEGFNFYAFLFPLLWTLYRRMWMTAFLLAVWQVLLMSAAHTNVFDAPGLFVLDLGMHIFVGFSANDWLRSYLGHRGYLFSDVTIADNKLGAQQRYFDRCLTPAAA
jgi:hypothetical protein